MSLHSVCPQIIHHLHSALAESSFHSCTWAISLWAQGTLLEPPLTTPVIQHTHRTGAFANAISAQLPHYFSLFGPKKAEHSLWKGLHGPGTRERNGLFTGLLCSRAVIAAGDDTRCNSSTVTAFSTQGPPNSRHTDKLSQI